jgi:hypothetical protein
MSRLKLDCDSLERSEQTGITTASELHKNPNRKTEEQGKKRRTRTRRKTKKVLTMNRKKKEEQRRGVFE